MYIPVVVPLAAKLMALRISVVGATLLSGKFNESAWSTGSVPTITIRPVTAEGHVASVSVAAFNGVVTPKGLQCGSENTIALYLLNWAVVIADHASASFTTTAYPAASAIDFSVVASGGAGGVDDAVQSDG